MTKKGHQKFWRIKQKIFEIFHRPTLTLKDVLK